MSTQSKHNKPSPFDWAMTGLFIVSLFLLLILSGCSPKVIVQKEVVTEYRDRLAQLHGQAFGA